MKFFKLLFFDIKNFLSKEWKKLLAVPVGFLAFCIAFYGVYVKNAPPGDTLGTLGDYWLYVFGGMKEYIPSRTESFKFPVIWTIVLLYLFYTTLYYPYEDLLGYGQNVLIRTRGRNRWWLSKCAWNVFAVLLFFALGAVTTLLFCAITGMPLSLEVSQSAYTDVFKISNLPNLGRIEDLITFPSHITGVLIGMPVLTAVAISQLQMLLSLWLRPMYSFGVTAVILVASAYYVNPLFVGNYAMAVRCDAVIKNGVNPLTGVLLLASLVVVCTVIGCIAFKRYDIINKEN